MEMAGMGRRFAGGVASTRLIRGLTLVAALAAILLCGVQPIHAQAVAAAPAALDKAILAEAEATVKAFNGGDAMALAGLFSPTGELVDENGNVFAGTQAITELDKKFFEKFPKAMLEMEVTATRPLGEMIAVELESGRVLASAELVVAGNSGDLLDERCADESDVHAEHGRTEAGMEQVEEACAGDW
jgi:uncharacterized protein (TIGR02246 family)